MKHEKWGYLRQAFLAASFFSIDILLRFFTRWLGFYSIYSIAPSLFSVLWITIIVTFLGSLNKRAGQVVYAVLYFFFSIYAVAQYIYYTVFDRFFFLPDIRFAAEGADFSSFVVQLISTKVIALLLLGIAVGIIGFVVFPNKTNKESRLFRRLSVIVLAVIGINLTPQLYQLDDNSVFDGPSEYKTFTSSGFDMELVGCYQFLARDAWISYLKPKADIKESKEKIDRFFISKPVHENNSMTGVLRGKNLLVVQMESIDDWVISEKTTPTIHRLMHDGINFINMYTPCYGTGWTLGTEFAFLSGLYQGPGVLSASNQARNRFPYSMPNLFSNNGYNCKSIHENTAMYYSRGSLHKALGVDYYSTRNLLKDTDNPEDDSTIARSDQVYSLMTQSGAPFFNYIITYTAHLPYSSEDALSEYALERFPEFNNSENSYEICALFAKAHITDEMFAVLLERLEEDSLLDNTVIVAFADHYCYGLRDKAFLNQVSDLETNYFLEKTPAFIWYRGCTSTVIYKPCQTIDFLPTIANLFALEDVYTDLLGFDIFDPSYKGAAMLPDNSWIIGDTVVQRGTVIESGGKTDDELNKLFQEVDAFYDVDGLILSCDYYAK